MSIKWCRSESLYTRRRIWLPHIVVHANLMRLGRVSLDMLPSLEHHIKTCRAVSFLSFPRVYYASLSLFSSFALRLSPLNSDSSITHGITMPWSPHKLCFATPRTMNEECRIKEIHGFADQSESKNDSDTQMHSEGGHDAYKFPEGGFRAWLVVSGSAASMFCTFGYLTGFGYVNSVWHQVQLGRLKVQYPTESISNGIPRTNSSLTPSQTSPGLDRSRYS